MWSLVMLSCAGMQVVAKEGLESYVKLGTRIDHMHPASCIPRSCSNKQSHPVTGSEYRVLVL